MNRKTWIAVSLAAAVLIITAAFLFSQQKPDIRSFPLRYLRGPEAADVLSGHLPPGAVEGWNDNAVFIRAKGEDLARAQEVLQREDQPPPQIMMQFQIIEANGFTATDSAIAPVEAVLRDLFRFRGYRLIAEAFAQSKEESVTSQAIIGSDGAQYNLTARIVAVARREGKTSAELSVELLSEGQKILETSVNVPTGQTVVLGTARPRANRGAMILVVTPQIK